MVHGNLTRYCYDSEDIPRHHFIWMQSTGWHIRSIHGYRSILW